MATGLRAVMTVMVVPTIEVGDVGGGCSVRLRLSFGGVLGVLVIATMITWTRKVMTEVGGGQMARPWCGMVVS
uniref:Uncharacterized protein n=1 Tax=Oryza punctata TaxID=4537 RepID=A0A0E0MKW1_ORYPU